MNINFNPILRRQYYIVLSVEVISSNNCGDWHTQGMLTLIEQETIIRYT